MTTVSDLSEDLVREILSSVSVTSLRAVRCTCKSWNALSKQLIFGKAQVEETQEFLGFMVIDSKVCSLRIDLHGICNHGNNDFVDPSIVGLRKSGLNIKKKTSKKNYGSGRHQKIGKSNFVKTIYPISIKQISEFNQVEVYDKVFHSGGLLLCVTKDRGSLMVWNPYLGQIRWIGLREQFRYRDRFILGYDNNNRNHKILNFCFGGSSVIYDFNSNSWRVVEFTPIWNLHRGCAVSLKGNTYFLVQDKIFTEEEEKFGYYLLCFDFTAERFGRRLPLPFHSNDYKAGAVTLSCARQEQLALLYYNCETVKSLEIWITNQVDPNAVYWSKFWKVDIWRTLIPKNILPGSFFIDQVKKVVVVSDLNEYNFRTKKTGRYQTVYIIGEDGYFKSFKLRCSPSNPHDFLAYAPSLVHIQTNQPGKRKRRKRKNNSRNITN